MTTVARTMDNLRKCDCMKCPSYNFACKVKSMPSNVILMMGPVGAMPNAEAMFCAFDKSRCIDEEKGCICATCAVAKENGLEKGFYCTVTGGK